MVVIDSITAQDRLLRRRKQLIAVGLITTGGVSGVHIIRKILRDALQEQLKICSSVDALEGKGGTFGGRRRSRSVKVAVDGVFARRLFNILRICVPNPVSPEAGLIFAQTVCLVARTFLTDVASQIEGGVGRYVGVCLQKDNP
jgi:ATP-binding cassette subfamily D (ALD) protein 3/ATP-binding cassette subfamily D (ALD) long-chain fatty acid import protein